jgi:hypothetical protein
MGRFLVKLKKTAMEAFIFLCEANGEGALSKSLCFQMAQGFQREDSMWKTMNYLVVQSAGQNVEN